MSGIINTVTEVATLGLVKDVTGAEAAGKAAQQAAGVQQQQALSAQQEQARQFDVTQANLAPFREAGVSALGQQQALLGLSGQEAQQEALGAFAESPGQRFIRERQERALLRNTSAIGGLGGGNIRTALQEQAAGIASTQLGEFQNRLAGLSGTGQTATTNLAQLGAQSQQQQALLGQQAAAARASGILGKTQAEAQATGQILQLGGQIAGGFA
jgi:hypothetical protein